MALRGPVNTSVLTHPRVNVAILCVDTLTWEIYEEESFHSIHPSISPLKHQSRLSIMPSILPPETRYSYTPSPKFFEGGIMYHSHGGTR